MEQNNLNNVRYLDGKAKAGSFLAGFPTTIMSTIIIVSWTYFCTDIVGLNIGIVTSIMFISQFIDCASDIVGGILIDKTKHPMGKSRIWIWRMAVPYMIFTFLLYVIPNGSDMMIYAYLFIVYNIANAIVYTMATIAAFTITSTMTKNPEERPQIAVFRQMGASCSELLITLSVFPITTALGGGRGAWLIVIGALSVISMISMFVCVRLIKELPPEELGQDTSEKLNILKAFKILLSNKFFWVVIIAWGFDVMYLNFSGTIAAYFCTYGMGMTDMASYILSMEKAASIVVLMLLVPLMLKKMIKKNIMFIGGIVAALGQLIVLIDLTSPTVALVAAVVRGFGFAMCLGMFSAWLADTVEYGHWKSGIRAEGITYSASTFAIKLFSAFAVAIMGQILDGAGYDGMAEVQTDAAMSAITNMYVWAPVIFFAVMSICALFFTVEKHMPVIARDIEAGNVGAKRTKI